MDDLPTYPYQTLEDDSRSIRLLLLEPAESRIAPIKCRLVTHRLDLNAQQADAYEALSYTWGGIDEEHQIILDNDYALRITGNLFEALIRLRSTSVPRALWVDAICIDQTDECDKTQQISIMRNIYHKAQCVIVWLGVEEDNSSLAIDYLNRRDCDVNSRFDNDLEAAFRALFARSWFYRVWILQEIAAARQLKILCGRSEVTGSVFCRQIKLLLQWHVSYNPLRIDEPRNKDHLNMLTTTIDLMSCVHLQASTLNQLLGKFRFREASIAHDLIFALVGMSSDASEAMEFKANYQKSWFEVVRSAFIWVTGAPNELHSSLHEGQLLFSSAGKVIGSCWTDRPDGTVDIRYSRKLGTDSHGVSSSYRVNNDLLIRNGDRLCLLDGLRDPVVLRLADDHIVFVGPAPKPVDGNQYGKYLLQEQESFSSSEDSKYDLLMVWHWGRASADAKETKVGVGHCISNKSSFSRTVLDFETMSSAPWQRRIPPQVSTAQGLQQMLDHMWLLQDFGHWDGAMLYLYGIVALYEPAASAFHADYPGSLVPLHGALAGEPLYFGNNASLPESACSPLKELPVHVDHVIDQVIAREMWLEKEYRKNDPVRGLHSNFYWSGTDLLSWAACAGANRLVSRFLVEVSDEKKNDRLTRALIRAINSKDLDVVRQIPYSTTDDPEMRHRLLRAIHLATLGNNDVGIGRYLLDKGFEGAVWDWADRPRFFHIAAGHENSKILELFLDLGGDPRVEYHGCAPLAQAIKHNRVRNVQLILQRGVDVNKPLEWDFGMTTAMQLAKASGNDELIELLLAHGAVDADTDDERSEYSDDGLPESEDDQSSVGS